MDSRPVAVVTMRRVTPTQQFRPNSHDMTEQTDKRAERLKAALRENLRRRKAQVRGRSQGSGRSQVSDGPDREETGPTSPDGDPPDGDPPQPSEDDPA